MEQLKLENGSTYNLVVGGVFHTANEKIQITILADGHTFSEIESAFENEANTGKMKVIDSVGDSMTAMSGYTSMDSITKQREYVTGSEEYVNDDGETSYRDVKADVYIITLSKPDLHAQVKSLQDTVDILVLDGLGVS